MTGHLRSLRDGGRVTDPRGQAARTPATSTKELPPAPNISLLAELGSLVGDPARTCMLISLRRAGEMTSRQLADAAGVAPQTASGHLSKLSAAGLVRVEKRGRFHFFRLASAHVHDLLDAIHVAGVNLNLGSDRPNTISQTPVRVCRGHLAGPIAVALARAILDPSETHGPLLNERGRNILSCWGLATQPMHWTRCLDHSEGVDHIGGELGAALMTQSLALGWVRQVAPHELVVTVSGWRGFQRRFAMDPRAMAPTTDIRCSCIANRPRLPSAA